MHRIGYQRTARVRKHTQLDKLGGAQARGEEYTTGHSKGYINVGENFWSEESARNNAGVLDKRILRSVNIVQQNPGPHLEERGDIFRTPGGCDHENLMLELVKL